jgi:hypothetical protein
LEAELLKGGFHWYYDTLTPSMAVFGAVVEGAIEEVVEHYAGEVQDYAQENAPWSDRTGAARDGLTAEASSHGTTHEIVLYHTEEYGIWLEIRNSGEYAIILPTLEVMGPRVMAALSIGGIG